MRARNNHSETYFVHGTSIDSRVWKHSVTHSIAQVFGLPGQEGTIKLIDWSGANNTQARKKASDALLKQIDRRHQKVFKAKKRITLVGQSHGGTVILYACQDLRYLLGPETDINILTLNTPNVVGGAKLEDDSIQHYHIYCKSDVVAPRGGYNRTGMLEKGGERKNWFGKPIGGEYSYKRDLGSGEEGSVKLEFESAVVNLSYKDQYRFKGLSPITHLVSHRGWLEKNVQQWLPKLHLEISTFQPS